jgi:threonine synthase
VKTLSGDDGQSAIPQSSSHGPTAAFKDFGARFLAEALSRIPSECAAHGVASRRRATPAAQVAARVRGRPGFASSCCTRAVSSPRARSGSSRAGAATCCRSASTAGSTTARALVKRALNDASLVAKHGLTSAKQHLLLGRLCRR